MKNRQINSTEHKAHMQHPSNYGTVSMRTDKKENWVVRGHFYGNSDSGAKQKTQVIHSALEGTCESWTNTYKWQRGKRNNITPRMQTQEASSTCVTYDDWLDCIRIDNMPADMISRSNPSRKRRKTKTKSEWISYRPVRFGIDMGQSKIELTSCITTSLHTQGEKC